MTVGKQRQWAMHRLCTARKTRSQWNTRPLGQLAWLDGWSQYRFS